MKCAQGSGTTDAWRYFVTLGRLVVFVVSDRGLCVHVARHQRGATSTNNANEHYSLNR